MRPKLRQKSLLVSIFLDCTALPRALVSLVADFADGPVFWRGLASVDPLWNLERLKKKLPKLKYNEFDKKR